MFRRKNLVIIVSLIMVVLFVVGMLIYWYISSSVVIAAWMLGTKKTMPSTTSMSSNKVFYKLKAVPEEVKAGNGRGKGLNLLLINNIQTECYVKEMLSFMADNQNGKIAGTPGASVSLALGTIVAEEGYYDGTLIACSMIPFENNKIMWNTSAYGVDASTLTLKNLNSSNLNVGGGTVPIWKDGLNADCKGPFQQSPDLFNHTKSSLSPDGKDSSRMGDPYYFPDELAVLDSFVKDISPLAPKDAQPELYDMIVGLAHNIGTSGVGPEVGGGVRDGRLKNYNDMGKSFQALYDDLTKSMATYGSIINKAQMDGSISGEEYKWWCILFLLEQGFSISDDGNGMNYLDTNYNHVYTAYHYMHPDKGKEDLSTFLNSKVSHFTAPNVTAYGRDGGPPMSSDFGFIYKTRSDVTSTNYNGTDEAVPMTNFIPLVSCNHMMAILAGGPFTYASMLKYAGVGVDPTNPETYMNSLPEGEWKPEDVEWMKQYNIDPSGMSEKSIKMLSAGSKLLGSPYVWGGNEIPKKDSNGNWSGGFDCSSFVRYCVQQAIGVDISRTTFSQIGNSNLTLIDRSQAKPGDLMYAGPPSAPYHVGIFIKELGNGNILMMHDPETGDVVKVKSYIDHTGMTFYRVKGVN